ncbi:MAG: hypothetical protein U0V74_09225 [Chitinophagales bacterium]
MRSMKVKGALAALAASAVLVLANTPVAAQTQKSSGLFNLEKADINKDLTGIKAAKGDVAHWKDRLHGERDRNMNTNATKKELRKSRADLKQAKAYLRADKHDLMADHKTRIAQQRAAVAASRTSVMAINVKPVGKNGLTAQQKKAEQSRRKQLLERDKQALNQAKIDRNNDVLAVNQKIENADVQNTALLEMQNTNARIQNNMLASE